MFDQEDIWGTPYRLSNNGTSFNTTTDICKDDTELTSGQILFSFSLMSDQLSCRANTQNAGNYYSMPTSVASGSKTSGSEENSICSKGWMMPTALPSDNKSFQYLLVDNYASSVTSISINPISFVRTGVYKIPTLSIEGRSAGGYYITSTYATDGGSSFLTINSTSFSVVRSHSYSFDYYGSKRNGYSLRCVDKFLEISPCNLSKKRVK